MTSKITKPVAAKKTAVKKVTVKKAVSAKKTVVNKVAAPKKTVAKKAVAPKKVATKKIAAKKVVAKKVSASKADLPSKTSKKKKKATVDNAELLVEHIIMGMQEKKAQRITVMDLRDVENAVTDFFVISQAESTTQVAAIADSVWEEVRKNMDEKPFHIEGKGASEWVLLDYVNVVAHVFQPDARIHYNLEKLWSEAIITQIKD